MTSGKIIFGPKILDWFEPELLECLGPIEIAVFEKACRMVEEAHPGHHAKATLTEEQILHAIEPMNSLDRSLLRYASRKVARAEEERFGKRLGSARSFTFKHPSHRGTW